MNVLLTGATGFLGWRTLEVLIRDPDINKIIATGRTLKLTHTIKHEKVNYILGNLEDRVFVNDLLKNIDTIINAAALSSPWGGESLFKKANINTQINLIKASKEHDIKRFIFISSPSVYFEYKDKFNIKESDDLPKKLVNQYAKSKRKAEVLLIKSGLPYVILRPRAIIGRGDTVIMPRLIRAVDEGRLKVIGNGKNIADLTSAENIANAILLSLKAKNTAINDIYNISNGDPVFLWDAIFEVLSRLGKKVPSKKVPFRIVKWVAKFLELKSRLTNNNEPPLTQYGVGTLAISLTMDISKAKNQLGYRPKVTTKEALNEFVNWYISHEKK
ncbi:MULTISPECIES: NAD(P)-dependent oxidoreductase [unclassified Polaribacter]|jgi:nucleoside-diphosphate-sugar epimerase|uniref:NAD-dependent epimerase/dehydratase family protein n=1 Tax=unclassified Polaribacter TaxID=196858 RepID=UPI00052BA7A2|nr:MULTISPECIES: NAD-dependent epimerase/dehydratase family protein [unclassified Polaribacter]KGL61264.1 3-beta hydroxysteroid dehydrogenase/isomerase family protein [Polaribacter sp. Hel1_33_49]PKV64461.1 nucleoside-diphosphate-sugar epimerase [Polaribacter sp. Hel1_33_96]